MKSLTVWHGHSTRPSLPAGTARKASGHLSGRRPLHLANARPFGRSKAPLGLLLLRKRELALAGRTSSSHYQQRETERSRRGTPCCTYHYCLSPIPEQQLHAAGVHVEMASSCIVLHVCVLSALRHSYSGLSRFLMIRSRTFFDGSKGFVLFSEEYKKSEPFSYRKKVRILLLWCTSRDLNPGPTD